MGHLCSAVSQILLNCNLLSYLMQHNAIYPLRLMKHTDRQTQPYNGERKWGERVGDILTERNREGERDRERETDSQTEMERGRLMKAYQTTFHYIYCNCI